jgi:hypothetical protein
MWIPDSVPSLFPLLELLPQFPDSVLSSHQLAILQSELHGVLQAAALYCFFDGGVVFGPQLALLGCDSGVDGSFLILGRGAAVLGADTGVQVAAAIATSVIRWPY